MTRAYCASVGSTSSNNSFETFHFPLANQKIHAYRHHCGYCPRCPLVKVKVKWAETRHGCDVSHSTARYFWHWACLGTDVKSVIIASPTDNPKMSPSAGDPASAWLSVASHSPITHGWAERSPLKSVLACVAISYSFHKLEGISFVYSHKRNRNNRSGGVSHNEYNYSHSANSYIFPVFV